MGSLADLQRGGAQPSPAAPTLPLDVQRVRTFDTPEFAGMTFHEVESKTALNRVKGMPFPWSINPYRGCSHACSYCLAGETPILMGDGRLKALEDLRPGDAVYGTRRVGRYRRYVLTEVRDHWRTRKPAYRVVLTDGTELIASGDHRFLTRRGWKHVIGTGCGAGQRAHLTPNDDLLGTGATGAPAAETPDYRRGYLCGMVRGDAHLGSYAYDRPGRAHGDVHRFRLALCDTEALERSQRYLALVDIPTRSFVFSGPTPTRQQVDGIRTSARSHIERISALIAWRPSASSGWARGFLAGIFDADGSCSRGVLRICNSDLAVIEQIESCLTRFDFRSVREPAANGCWNVRLLGGLVERQRFFHLVDPAITRKLSIEGMALKSSKSVRVVGIEPLGRELELYDISTGTGDFIANGVVSHNCFARPTHTYLNLNPLGDFEKTVVVKTNVVEVLRRELAKPSWSGEHVAMGTNTDPYQRCEGRYRLMPGIIEALAESLTPFSILTKGTLITRDLELLAAAAERVPVAAALTVGMLDEALWRSSEPGTPSPRARLDAVRALNDAGIPTGVMLAPIMPGLNDDAARLRALVDAAARAGAVHITPIVLHLRPGVREVFWPWLTEHHPELVDRYAALYRRADAGKAYRDEVGEFIRDERRAAWRRHGKPPVPSGWRGSRDDRRPPVTADPVAAWPVAGGAGATAVAEQLRLL
jgi:DNA repair photolyase